MILLLLLFIVKAHIPDEPACDQQPPDDNGIVMMKHLLNPWHIVHVLRDAIF